MVNYDVNRVGGALEFGTLILEGSYNSYKFFIIYLVVIFGGDILPGEVGNKSKDIIIVILR